MKLLLSLLMGLSLLIGGWIGVTIDQPAMAQGLSQQTIAQFRNRSAKILHNPVDEKLGKVGSKIDLNNSSVLTFRRYRGMYPTLARKVIEHAPFDTVEDVLEIKGLNNRELDILKANLDNFVVTPDEPALTEGGDRINPGIYK